MWSGQAFGDPGIRRKRKILNRDCDIATQMVEEAARVVETARKLRKACERHRNVAKVSDKVEGEVNEALEDLSTALVASTTVASSWSCVTWDRAENEQKYLDTALRLLNSIVRREPVEEYEEDAFEDVAVENQ